MLYLPAVNLEGNEIRLPVSADGMLSFFCLFDEERLPRNALSEIFANDPGLLLFAAVCCTRETGKPVLSSDMLEAKVRESILKAKLGADTFEFVSGIGPQHWDRFCKWRKRPGFKSLRRFIQTFCDVPKAVLKMGISKLFDSSFDFAVFDTEQMPDDSTFIFANDQELRIPLRLIWLSQCKLKNLQDSFDQRLHESKMLGMKQLAYGASHEINNPLANIASRAQVLMGSEKNLARQQQLATIYSQSIRAHEMISDLMLFAHPPQSEFESVQVFGLVNKLTKELSDELKAAAIKIRICQYPGGDTCDLDPTQISEALKAIIQNSVIAIGYDGEIVVQIWQPDQNHLSVAIRDSGNGVEDSLADQVFDPFYSSREAGRGLGFGLSKAWRIAELHGGKLELDRSYQAGARFVLTLPVRQTNSKKKPCRIDNARAA